MPFNYYKMLADPTHAWLSDPDSPFRSWQSRKYPFIHFKFRRFKRKSYGRELQLLKYPVAECPCLYKPAKPTARLSVGYPCDIKAGKDRFNYLMERLIKIWHREAEMLNCDHDKPFVRMSDDSLANLFPLI
tara:strand:+ start:254 stop:646 length:393 start_codon:yes stop_codon:yes gene_type:complete